MSEPQYVETRRQGRTLTITLRKPKVNAIDYVLSRQVYAALRQLQDDPDLIVGVLTAEGDRIFSGGMDLKAFAAQELNPERDADPVNGWGPGGFAGINALKFQQMIRPGQPVRLELVHDAAKGSLNFRYFSEAGAHASGRVLLGT